MNRLDALPFLLIGPLTLAILGCSSDPGSSDASANQSTAGDSAAAASGGMASGVGGGSDAAEASSGGGELGGGPSAGGSSSAGGNSTGTSLGGTSGSGGNAALTGGGSSGSGMGGTASGSGGSSFASGGAATAVGGSSTGAGGTPAAVGGSSNGVGGASDGTGGGSATDCDFTVSHSVSEVIPTVGIVEWSLGAAVDSAHIEFGLDTGYGLTAPVDLSEPGYRTLLLGMKGSRDYHYRIVANTAGGECTSTDSVLTTGSIPNGIDRPEVATALPEQLAGGYLITGRWGNGAGGPAFILDADAEIVWWYETPEDVMRARLSADGKWMWMRNTAQTNGTGLVQRVTLDGLIEEDYSLPATTHDLAVLPDGHVGLIGHTDGCDEILDFNPEDGSLVSVFNLADAHGNDTCHVNFIGYSAADDTFIVSDWENDCYVKVSREGALVWVLNGPVSSFQGTSWSRQHGLHEISPGRVLLFSNGATGSTENSIVYEYELDDTNWSATELWRYDAGISITFGGDVQRVDNGNTVISYSSDGVIQEVNAAGELIQEMVWPIGFTVSYIMKQGSLYGGPPPRM